MIRRLSVVTEEESAERICEANRHSDADQGGRRLLALQTEVGSTQGALVDKPKEAFFDAGLQ
jgi:hypothetical protein